VSPQSFDIGLGVIRGARNRQVGAQGNRERQRRRHERAGQRWNEKASSGALRSAATGSAIEVRLGSGFGHATTIPPETRRRVFIELPRIGYIKSLHLNRLPAGPLPLLGLSKCLQKPVADRNSGPKSIFRTLSDLSKVLGNENAFLTGDPIRQTGFEGIYGEAEKARAGRSRLK